MATYDYHCAKCNIMEEHAHSMKEDPVISCKTCGHPMDRQISYNFGGFNIKGGTPTTHWKEKRLQTKMNENAGERMKKKFGDIGPKITPNIAGVPQESWSDCQKLAKECGMNSDSYKPLVEKEKDRKIQVVKS